MLIFLILSSDPPEKDRFHERLASSKPRFPYKNAEIISIFCNLHAINKAEAIQHVNSGQRARACRFGRTCDRRYAVLSLGYGAPRLTHPTKAKRQAVRADKSRDHCRPADSGSDGRPLIFSFSAESMVFFRRTNSKGFERKAYAPWDRAYSTFSRVSSQEKTMAIGSPG